MMWHQQFIRSIFAASIGAAVSVAALASAGAEKLSFPSLDEDLTKGAATTLDGYLFASKSTARTPAVVLAHGCSGMLDAKGQIRTGIMHWAHHFQAKGWRVLAVDSFNPRGHAEVCTQSNRPILESRERPRDAYGALKYLRSREDVDPKLIFMMGFSNGATGTLYAIEDGGKPLVRAQGLAFRAAIAFYPGCTSANKARLRPSIPLAIMIGADDDWTPAAPCLELISTAKSRGLEAEIYSYSGAYHGFDVPGSKLRVRKDVRMAGRANLAAGVHVGGNESARLESIRDADAFLSRYLPPSAPVPAPQNASASPVK